MGLAKKKQRKTRGTKLSKRHFQKIMAESQVISIAGHIGKNRETREIDLEKGEIGYKGEIRMLDSFVLKAARGEFEIVFLGIDRKGGLVCQLYDHKVLREQRSLKKGEVEKVWSGMLKGGQTFSVSVKMLPDPSKRDAIAKVDIRAEVSEESVFR